MYRQRQQDVAAVVLDYSMPGMNGKAAFEELRAISTEAKVILCSGYTEEDNSSAFGEVRPSAFFQKPCKPSKLLEQVSNLISVPPRA